MNAVWLAALALALDITALVHSVARFVGRGTSPMPRLWMAAGLAAQAGFLALTPVVGNTRFGVGGIFMLAGSVLLVLLLAMELAIRETSLAAYGMPLVTFLHLVGYGLVGRDQTNLDTTVWLVVHVALLGAAEACFLLAGVFAMLFLAQDRALRQRRAAGDGLPSLERSARYAFRLMATGFPLFTFGLAIGVARRAKAGLHADDPVVLASVPLWIALALLLGFALARGRGRRTAIFTAGAAVLSVVVLLFLRWHGAH